MAVANPEFSTGENTMVSLKEFLLNMKGTIERICTDHALASNRGILVNSQSCYDTLGSPAKGFLQPFQGAMAESAGKSGQHQNWFPSQGSTTSQAVSKCVPTGKVDSSSCSSALSEVEIGNALNIFLQDMKKTIDTWSNRYQVLIKGKTFGANALPQPMYSDVNVVDQLAFGPDETDRDFSVMEVLDLPHSQALQASKRPKVARTNQGRKGRKVQIQSHQSRNDATLFSLQDFNEVMGSAVTTDDQDSRPEGPVEVHESAENDHHNYPGQMEMQRTCYNGVHRGDMGTEEVLGNDLQEPDNAGAIVLVEKTDGKTGQRKRKPRRKSTTPINSQELTIRNFQSKVEVVESPDWLPKGWITELKTRSSGGSAGTKDKYYYDPVSKRRCRSQKEVFSLLETGKLGRYKPRANKLWPSKQTSCAEAFPAPNTDNVNDIRSLKRRQTAKNTAPHQVTSETTSSGISMGPHAISPGAPGHTGALNHIFLPYRPGQPSDWLVYESLTNTPRPVLENFRFTEINASRPNGDRGSPSWPWFLNNPDSSMRPFVDRFGMGKATLGGKDDMLGVGGQVAMTREPCFNESVAKRVRKPSKRAGVFS